MLSLALYTAFIVGWLCLYTRRFNLLHTAVFNVRVFLACLCTLASCCTRIIAVGSTGITLR